MTPDATSLSERADACLAALDDAGQAIARRVLLRLVRFGDGGADRSRRQPLSALGAGGEPARVAAVVHHLAEARLVTLDGDRASGDAQVAVPDDALIAAWPTLQTWIATHGRTEQLRRQLENDAAEWRAGGSTSDAGLFDKAQLAELAAWLTPDARRDLGVSEIAESFIAASDDAARRRWWPRRAPAGTILAILLMLLLLATPIILLLIVVLTASMIHRFH